MQELEKRIRLLERKLERSERNQAELEEQRRKGQVLYRKLHDDLARMQAQLIQAEKLASLGQLTAGIAHEIKNPLNFVNNFAEVNEELISELLEELESMPSNAPDSLRELLEDLKRNSAAITSYGRRADAIVKGMMDHAGGGRSEPEETDINMLLAQSVEKVVQQVGETSVPIDTQSGDTLPSVTVIPQEIERVIVGLIRNAMDALEGSAAPQITVSTAKSGRGIEVAVADNGPGIPENIRDRVFEPFFTTKPTGSGTGLGLSLAYDIVVQGHGGKLTFETQSGLGTTFKVWLPT